VPGRPTPAVLLYLILLLVSLPLGAAPKQIDRADTRVLIDISGSMKKSDPANLRRPALRLLVGLLPAESRAGVWTFGQYVNMQIPLGKVDEAWRKRARKSAGKIHSRGLFTNIEDALKRATADWKGASTRYQRHLVLLTDGVVDVSKDASKSAASRKRILQQLLPQLKAYGARVHTIALSERADHDLMRALSRETGGWYEQVNDASQLQRVFLRIFEKVGKPDTVPLKDNKFFIDSSIKEATLLVFRSPDGPPTRVTSPDGKSFSADDAPANVSWHRDEGYDMLTIKGPKAGEWRIAAALDPDNRVLVVTDLKMRVSDVPSRLIAGERLPLDIAFSDQDEAVITRRAFLDLVSLQAEIGTQDGPGEPRPVLDDGQSGDRQAGDGHYTLVLGEELVPGRLSLTIDAQGSTFQRSRRQTFEVILPLEIQQKVTDTGGKPLLGVRVTPAADALEMASVSLQGQLVSAAGEQRPVMLLPAADGVAWETEIDLSQLSGEWQLSIHLNAKARSGNPIELDAEPIPIQGRAEEPKPVEPAVAAPAPPDPAQSEEQEDGTDSGWMMKAGLFAGGNLVLLLLAGGGYWLFRRRASRDLVQLVDDEQMEAPSNDGD